MLHLRTVSSLVNPVSSVLQVIQHVPSRCWASEASQRPSIAQALFCLLNKHDPVDHFSSHHLSRGHFTVLGCFLQRTCTLPTLRSCTPTPGLSSSSTKSTYCHSVKFTDISTEIPCSLIISPWESHSATRVTMLSISRLDTKLLESIMDCHCTLLKTVVRVFWLCTFCRTVDLVVGHPRPSLAGIGCTVGVLAGTYRCALMPKVASRLSANPFCGCWSVVLSMSLVHTSKHVQRDFTALLLYVFRV